MEKELVSVAPMIQITDSPFRYFVRLLSKKIWLYTEMIPAMAISRGKRLHLLDFHPTEKPLVVQFAGNSIEDLQIACQQAEQLGFTEVNLNIGCPSKNATAGGFGLCQMKDPEHLANLFAACCQALKHTRLTIKTRIGVDEHNTEDFLVHFLHTMQQAGCEKVILHARCGLTKGLSPQQNRRVPSLNWELALAMKKHFPMLELILNGGIGALSDCRSLIKKCDGLMIGRKFTQGFQFLQLVDHAFFSPGETSMTDITQAIIAYSTYCQEHKDRYSPLQLARPIYFLNRGLVGKKKLALQMNQFVWEQLVQKKPIAPMVSLYPELQEAYSLEEIVQSA